MNLHELIMQELNETAAAVKALAAAKIEREQSFQDAIVLIQSIKADAIAAMADNAAVGSSTGAGSGAVQ